MWWERTSCTWSKKKKRIRGCWKRRLETRWRGLDRFAAETASNHPRNLTPLLAAIKIRRSVSRRGIRRIREVCEACQSFSRDVSNFFRRSAEHTMREAVTVLAVSRGGRARMRMEGAAELVGTKEFHREPPVPRNIALFRNRANGYCGPFTGRQAAVSLYLIGCEEKTARGNWRTLDR